MPEEPLQPVDEKSLRYMRLEGRASAVQGGVFERFVSPFAIQLGATSFHIGLLSALPQLSGSLLQFFSPLLIRRLKSRKKLIMQAAFLQSFTWLLMALVAFYWRNPLYVVIIATAFAGLEGLIKPAWTSLIGDIVPINRRNRFFGRRQQISAAIVLVVTVGSGVLLTYVHGTLFYAAFAGLFLLCMVTRLVSFGIFARVHESPHPVSAEQVSVWAELRGIHRTNFGRFLFFMAFFNFAVQISAPFFAVYMLRDLHFTFLHYVVAVSVSIFSSALMSYYWGHNADKFGTRTVMVVTGLVVPFLPLLWLVTSSLRDIIIIQLLSGFVWAGFNLATFTYLFDAVPNHRRAHSTAYINAFSSMGIVGGSLLGGMFADNLPTITAAGGITSVYFSLFIISGVLRLVVLLLFIPLIKDVQPRSDLPRTRALFIKLIALDPSRMMFDGTVKGLTYSYTRVESTRQQMLNAQRSTLHVSRRVMRDLVTASKQQQQALEKIPVALGTEFKQGIKELQKTTQELEKQAKKIQQASAKFARSSEVLPRASLVALAKGTAQLQKRFDALQMDKLVRNIKTRQQLQQAQKLLVKTENAALKDTERILKNVYKKK